MGIALGVFASGSECVCTSTTRETLEALDQLPPFDLILLDLNLPGADGFSCLVSIRSKVPSVPVMIVSSTDNEATVRESFSHGAMGYLPKSSSQEVMKNAIRLVMSGSRYIPTEALGELVKMSPAQRDHPKAERTGDPDRKSTLTPRQLAVLDLLAEGKANKIIAYELAISEITVKAHVSAILRKLGVSNRLQAVIAAKGLTE